VHRHRFEPLMPTGIRLSILMPIQIRILPQALHMLENLWKKFFLHSSASLHCTVLSFSQRHIILNILDSVFNFSFKRYYLALHFLLKTAIYQPWTSIKDVQVTEKVFTLKRTSGTSKHEI